MMKVKIVENMNEDMRYMVEVNGEKVEFFVDGCYCSEKRNCLGKKMEEWYWGEGKGKLKEIVGKEFEVECLCFVDKEIKEGGLGMLKLYLEKNGLI